MTWELSPGTRFGGDQLDETTYRLNSTLLDFAGFLGFEESWAHNSTFIQTIKCKIEQIHTDSTRRSWLEGSPIFLMRHLESYGSDDKEKRKYRLNK